MNLFLKLWLFLFAAFGAVQANQITPSPSYSHPMNEDDDQCDHEDGDDEDHECDDEDDEK